jgi:hypothetical protein
MTILYNVEKYTAAIDTVISQKRANNSAELEWRLGRVEGSHFVSQVAAAETLLEHYKFTKTTYTVMLYANGLRVRDGRPEKKKRIAHADLDYLPLGARLSLASESADFMPAVDEIPTGTREIERWTAPIKGADIMISRVDGQWEVEIEFTSTPSGAEEVLAPLREVLARLVRDRPNMVAVAEIRQVASGYNQFWHDCAPAGFLRRVGRKPLNFVADDCAALLAGHYAATNKLDGSKYVLICTDTDVFAVSEVDAIHIATSPLARKFVSMWFDGEWDPHDQTFQLFDFQTRSAMGLRERMAMAEGAVKQLAIKVVQCKMFDYSRDPLKATQAVIAGMKKRYGKDWNERNDGIIYIPEAVSYLAGAEREKRTLKWKFPDKISIDLRLRAAGESLYNCYAAAEHGETQVQGVQVTTSDKLDGVISEIGLSSGKFYVMRTRPDKTAPNFITVVTETLKDMRNPFTLEQLLAALKRKTGGGSEGLEPPTPELLKQAVEHVETDRAMFDRVLQAILKFAASHKLRLSNPESIRDNALPTVINIYAADGLRTANNLANDLYSLTPIVFMKTVIPYEEFEISVLNRQVARIYAYPRVRHIRTEKLFRSVPIKLDGIDVETMHREIELIAIYHTLYKPFPDKWSEAVALERALWNIKGGSAPADKVGFVREVRSALYAAMEFTDLGVLVGHWGYHELTGTGHEPVQDKLQILSDAEPEAMRERVEGLLADVSPVKLQWKTEEVFIPHDMLLRRTTFYFDWQGKRTPLFDMYNSLQYEIVPVVTGQVKKLRVGNPYVLQRFFLIDLWTIAVLETGNYIPREVATQKRAVLLERVSELRAERWTAMCGGDEYVGTYKDLAIERRRVLKQEEKFRPYKPLEYFERFGKLRQMQ